MSAISRSGSSAVIGQQAISRRAALAATGVGAAAVALAQGQEARAQAGKLAKEVVNLGMPWEEQYGYAQGVKIGDTVYVSGQLSHDDAGNMVAPAPLDGAGKIAEHANMGPQMAQSYANIAKVLSQYGLTMDSIVEEVLYVTDMDAAFAVAGEIRRQAYGGMPVVASTILVTPRLAFPDQLIEIKVTAKV
ncbi:MAG TPA: RidA family protein [Geminicoccaceae bacterium]|nr:RidA family protein [Geminicoccaceae bacterium]